MSLFGKLKQLFTAETDADRPADIALREGSPELEYFVAAAELERGEDLGHGARHLAELLAFDPGRPDGLALLERYLERAGDDPESLLVDCDEGYFAAEALRAYLWARQGRVEEAVNLLTQVVVAKPDTAYLTAWAVDWLEPAGVLESLEQQVVIYFLTAALNQLPEHRALTVRREKGLLRLIELGERFAAQFELDALAVMTLTGLQRKAGRWEAGAELLARVEGDSWHAAVAEGLLLREQGKIDRAVEALGRAIAQDPDDLSARLEAGDARFNNEQWAAAATFYREVLAREPEHPWAQPSLLWCQWRQTSEPPLPDDHLPEELIELARDGNPRANGLLGRFRPYEGYLPAPRDATINVLGQVLEAYEESPPEAGGGGSVSLRLSDVEGPSAKLAFELAMRAVGAQVTLDLTYEHVATPDPREPVEPVELPLWQRDGELLIPARPPPPAEVSEAIAALAEAPFDPERSWAAASRVAARFGPERVDQVLACMVNPPEVPAGADPILWLPRVQYAAAEVIAHLDDPWEGSARRRALYSLLLGPRDWTTEAAILALTRIAQEQPAIATDLHAAFTKLDDARPDSGFLAYESTLFSSWLGLPGLFDNERQALEARLAALDEED